MHEREQRQDEEEGREKRYEELFKTIGGEGRRQADKSIDSVIEPIGGIREKMQQFCTMDKTEDSGLFFHI